MKILLVNFTMLSVSYHNTTSSMCLGSRGLESPNGLNSRKSLKIDFWVGSDTLLDWVGRYLGGPCQKQTLLMEKTGTNLSSDSRNCEELQKAACRRSRTSSSIPLRSSGCSTTSLSMFWHCPGVHATTGKGRAILLHTEKYKQKLLAEKQFKLELHVTKFLVKAHCKSHVFQDSFNIVYF